MFCQQCPDSDTHVPPVAAHDAQVLRNLAIKYGAGTLIQTLQGLEESARYSAVSASSASSHPSLTSVAWNRSEASLCASDATSFHGSTHSGAPWHDIAATGADVGTGAVPGYLCTPPLSGTASPSGTVAAADWAEPQTAPTASFLLSPYLELSRKQDLVPTAQTSSPRIAFPPSPGPSSSSRYSQPPPTTSTASTTSTTTTPRKPIECPLCAVYDITVGFRRKSDFKKHLQNFHPTDSLWVCRQPDCRTVFDVERAYVQHIRTEHGHPSPDSALPSADAARVPLCPQLVFACGFLGCKTVLEARDASDSPAVADRYFDHLAGHFDGRSKPSSAPPQSEWTYYTQMQNLLRQSALKEDWKAASWNKTVRTHLRWQPRSSGDLKKLLETRHLGDVPRLLHAAFTLGSSSFADPEHPPPPSFPGESSRPVRGTCPLSTESGVCAVSWSSSFPSAADLASAKMTPVRGGLGPRRGLGVTPLKIVTSGVVGAGCLSAPFLGRTQPPPRSVPDEPDSVDGYPHPGTPFAVPETENWVDDDESLFGPRVDVGLFDPATRSAGSLKDGHGLLQPSGGVLSAELWPGAEVVGKQAQVLSSRDNGSGEGASPRTPNKRGLAWGRRSWEGSRFMKRRAAHFSESGFTFSLHMSVTDWINWV
ncbi:hypothetical protein ACRALDRAFT_1069119 [Sodiomyces alcalophilus JCM 7366]|uniref:uncharacterized protein n=1 Tax=Sodiomyces alcalophilus JCM 7366 TaxID=591952 RepID=UPI0039B520B2